MGTLYKRVELLASIAIIAVAVLLGAVLINRYLLPGSNQPDAAERARIEPGTKLVLPGVDWAASERTLLMVLSSNCKFCTESAPFYQKLAQEKSRRAGLRMLAVLPQEVERARDYLNGMGVPVDGVLQAPADSFGVRGTPTLIIVNNEGSVQDSWVGKLPSAREAEVFSRL